MQLRGHRHNTKDGQSKIVDKNWRGARHPATKKWRKEVLKQDKYKCRMPGCKKKAEQVHHILPYSPHCYLRLEVSNGISLCKTCHKEVTKRETHYAQMFLRIAAQR